MQVKAFVGGGIGYVTVDLEGLGPQPTDNTAATVIGGETYDMAATDVAITFDSSNGERPIAQMTGGPSAWYIGQRFMFDWFNWATGAGQPVGPEIIAPSGVEMVPFGGQQTAGTAGLVSSTVITTPGASFTLEWNGTFLAAV